MNKTWWVKPEDLDEDQKSIIELPLKGSHLILGPPGSGKTNLLLLRADYYTKAGKPDLYILVFTRTLREFLVMGGIEYNFSKDKIMTDINWVKNILWQNGIEPIEKNDFETMRTSLFEQLSELIDRGNISHIHDVILLDEAHDYSEQELSIFRKYCNILFAVADPKQRIYKKNNSVEYLKSIISNTHILKYHYRNGREICKLADELGKKIEFYEPMTPTSNYNEAAMPSSVNYFECEDMEEQAQKIIKSLKTQIKAYPNELLGVITPRHEELNEIWKYISSSELGKISVFQSSRKGYCSFDTGQQICVCSLHSAKGLEFRTLHIAGAEYLKNFARQKSMSFTGITRAKTSLSVYSVGNLPGYLEGAFTALNPPSELPKLSDLFRKGK